MDQNGLIEGIKSKAAMYSELGSLFLVGSYGRGTADSFSDVDLVAVAESARKLEFARIWQVLFREIAPVVLWRQREANGILINAITELWLRCDLLIVDQEQFGRRSKDTVKVLVDIRGLYDALPDALPPTKPNPRKLELLIEEFLRVLGLLHVVVGRAEYLTGMSGVELLREKLKTLLIEEKGLTDPGGALHLSRILPPNEIGLLENLTPLRPTRESIIASHLEVAGIFLPKAKIFAARVGAHWPTEFENATREVLKRQLNQDLFVAYDT
jgi:hypothetical protein